MNDDNEFQISNRSNHNENNKSYSDYLKSQNISTSDISKQNNSKFRDLSKNSNFKKEIIDFDSKNNSSNFSPDLNKRKIVIVEDDSIINDTIKTLMKKIFEVKNLDISIIQCYDGIDLLKEIIDDQKNGNLIDLIIMDENMEFMNGTQALTILNDLESKRKAKIPYIVSTTTYQFSTKKMNFLKIKRMLPKPIDRNSMVNVLKELKYFE